MNLFIFTIVLVLAEFNELLFVLIEQLTLLVQLLQQLVNLLILILNVLLKGPVLAAQLLLEFFYLLLQAGDLRHRLLLLAHALHLLN